MQTNQVVSIAGITTLMVLLSGCGREARDKQSQSATNADPSTAKSLAKEIPQPSVSTQIEEKKPWRWDTEPKAVFEGFCAFVNRDAAGADALVLESMKTKRTCELFGKEKIRPEYLQFLKNPPPDFPPVLTMNQGASGGDVIANPKPDDFAKIEAASIVSVERTDCTVSTVGGGERLFQMDWDMNVIVERTLKDGKAADETGRWKIIRKGTSTEFEALHRKAAASNIRQDGSWTGPWRIKGCLFSNASVSQSGENVTFSTGGGGALPRNLGVLIEFAEPPSKDYLANFVITMDGAATGELAWAQKTDDGQIVYFSRNGGWPLGKEFTLSGNGHKQASKTPPVVR